MSVAIVGGGASVARALAQHIAERGTSVVTIGDGTVADSGAITHLSCDVSSATELQDCFSTAAADLAGPPALVRLGVCTAQTSPTALAAMSLADWVARVEAPLRDALAFHQAAQRFLADRTGRVVVVVGTVGLSGGPGYVPWAATTEADRSLVKAQARVSGGHGTTINCVAVASVLFAGVASDVDPDRSGLPPHAHPAPGLAQVAAVILGLLGPAFDGVTGQTIAVDGGRWMAP